jgi:hypothetical protein
LLSESGSIFSTSHHIQRNITHMPRFPTERCAQNSVQTYSH